MKKYNYKIMAYIFSALLRIGLMGSIPIRKNFISNINYTKFTDNQTLPQINLTFQSCYRPIGGCNSFF